MIEAVKFITQTKSGSLVKVAGRIERKNGRIWFVESPFALKDEIKAMQGSRWHGFDDPPIKMWSVEDSQRNNFQLSFLQGEDVYAWFEREIIKHVYTRPLMLHQCDIADHFLTYHYGICAAEMGTGKTLSIQEVMERSGKKVWWWAGPKPSLPNIEREFKKWGIDPSLEIEMMTYEALTRRMDAWKPGDPLPDGFIADESSRLKTPTSQRSKGAQKLADQIRQKYGFEGYVIEMSGTPSPKSPVDWWSQTEIAWPGFLKEGSPKALEHRMGFLTLTEYDGGQFHQRTDWRDNELKCDKCGKLEEDGCHDVSDEDYHQFKPSVNEVAYMYERLQGLVIIKHAKDCIDLPELRHRQVICKPTNSLLRLAAAVKDSAPNAVTAMTMLRELSDGFQYREEADGTSKCTHCTDGEVDEWFDPEDEERTYEKIDLLDPERVADLQKRRVPCPVCGGTQEVTKYVRTVKEIPCPKAAALKELLDLNEEQGRLVIFAGFTGSIDKCVDICRKQGWDVVRLDGRGYQVTKADGTPVTDVQGLDYWADLAKNQKVAFVAHPESGGMSLTLVEARMEVFWSNSLKPEYRIQAIARIHRLGADMNLGCEIVDLIHLPTDIRALEIIQENRRIELMTMGDVFNGINFSSDN